MTDPIRREPEAEPRDDGLPEVDHHVPPEADLIGEDENPEGVEQLDPLLGLMDPEVGTNTPAADADAPAPPG